MPVIIRQWFPYFPLCEQIILVLKCLYESGAVLYTAYECNKNTHSNIVRKFDLLYVLNPQSLSGILRILLIFDSCDSHLHMYIKPGFLITFSHVIHQTLQHLSQFTLSLHILIVFCKNILFRPNNYRAIQYFQTNCY